MLFFTFLPFLIRGHLPVMSPFRHISGRSLHHHYHHPHRLHSSSHVAHSDITHTLGQPWMERHNVSVSMATLGFSGLFCPPPPALCWLRDRVRVDNIDIDVNVNCPTKAVLKACVMCVCVCVCAHMHVKVCLCKCMTVSVCESVCLCVSV